MKPSSSSTAVFGNKFRGMGRGIIPNRNPSSQYPQTYLQHQTTIPAVTALDDTTNVHQLMKHFSKILTKHGARGEDVLANVSATLRHRYQHPSPIQVAIDAIKPVLKFQKFKTSKNFTPVVLHPKPSIGIALRWIVQQAGQRTYVGGRPCLERGLVDEIDGIIQGTSSLFARRMQFHKNPN